MAVYCLRGPRGKLYDGTVSSSRDGAWIEAFPVVCERIPGF